MSSAYWEIGRRIVENEQGGEEHPDYGKELLKRLSADFCARKKCLYSRHKKIVL